jgi:hypothetical protein
LAISGVGFSQHKKAGNFNSRLEKLLSNYQEIRVKNPFITV